MSQVSSLLLLILPALVIVAALTDVTTFRIPNWISIAAVLAFAPAALLMGADLPAIGIHFGVGILALAAGMGMWSVRWVGGGDAKLLAASALWIGYPAVGMFLLITALAGGALAVTLLNLRSGWVRAMVPVGPRWMERLREQGGDVPYGLAICVGALAAFPGGDLVKLLIA
ncbi:MAG TPA: prepilin peptidase [Caulobacteraceae bacterium]|nr:prepilin peptidase [Caulobacteraceae bacterium]